MAKDSLFRDAITEAKQMREVAMANARLALEQTFQPQLSSMLASQLRNEMEDHTTGDAHGTEDGGETDTKAVMEQNKLDTSDIGTSDNKSPSTSASDSSKITNPNQEVETFGEAVDGAIVNGDAHEKVLDQLKEDDDELDFDVDDDNAGEEDQFDSPEDGAEDFSDDGLDLEDIIASLEADIHGDEEPMDDMEEDLSMAASRDSVVQTQDEEPHMNPAGERDIVRLEARKDDNDDEDDKVDLDEILREMSAMGAGTDPNHYASVEKLQKENANLKKSLKEHRDVIQFLRERNSEVNMLNSKLLYANKLFKEHDLTAKQKMHIIETFDRAGTPRELKLLFATLAESYTTSKPKVSKSTKAITEGMASKPTASTKPKSPAVLNEDNEAIVARFKKLSGQSK